MRDLFEIFLVLFSVFVKKKKLLLMRTSVLKTTRPESGFRIGRKLGKSQWCHNLSEKFLKIFVSPVKFSYWCDFNVNIITGSGVMTISFYKGLTWNPQIRNTLVWVFSSIWRLSRVRDTKLGTNVFNKMLLNAAKCQGYSLYNFRVIKGNPTGRGKTNRHPPRLGLKMVHLWSIATNIQMF